MKFIINSFLLGAGLAMDAVTVSMANGLAEKGMQEKKRWSIAGVYGFFQFLMPLLGWIMVHCLLQYFHKLESLIPWISLGLLLYIGGKMLIAGIQKKEEEAESILTKRDLLLQGIATSIDALSGLYHRPFYFDGGGSGFFDYWRGNPHPLLLCHRYREKMRNDPFQ